MVSNLLKMGTKFTLVNAEICSRLKYYWAIIF